jgi:hypothetical protein
MSTYGRSLWESKSCLWELAVGLLFCTRVEKKKKKMGRDHQVPHLQQEDSSSRT